MATATAAPPVSPVVELSAIFPSDGGREEGKDGGEGGHAEEKEEGYSVFGGFGL